MQSLKMQNIVKDVKQKGVKVGVENCAATLENKFGILICLSYDPAIMFLGIFPRKLKLTTTQKPTSRCS